MSFFKFIQKKIIKDVTSSNNNNNNTNILTSVLNYSIFREVAIYLVYYNLSSFKKVLELSLISKAAFKLIKNIIISFKFSEFKFIIPKEDDLIKYIKFKSLVNKELSDEDIYNLKLIQYRDIEYITFQSHMDYNKHQGYNDKIFLKQNCNNLKQVKILGIFHFDFQNHSEESVFDYTQNGIYKFKWLMWDFRINNEYISLLKPQKLFLFSNMPLNTEQEDLILSCDSIDTYKFYTVDTSDSFVGKVFSNTLTSKSVKALYLRINPFSFIENINYHLSKNTTLKKLVLLNRNFHLYNQNTQFKSSSPQPLFYSMANNQSIEKLGLIAYNIRDSSILSPLKKIKNINTLYCDCEYQTLSAHLKHCKSNKNIKKLHISDNYSMERCFDKRQIMVLLNFIKENKSLKSLVWQYSNRSYVQLFNSLEPDSNTELFFNIFKNNNNNDKNTYSFVNDDNIMICKLKL